MKTIYITLFLVIGLIIMNTTPSCASIYDFDGTISCETLEAYLSRAIEMCGVCVSGDHIPELYQEDNLRAIANIKPKFIGRATLSWGCPKNDEIHYKAAKEEAAKVHAIDPEIILQACVFETAYSCKSPEAIAAGRSNAGGVENIPIPAWVFEAFGLTPEERCFDYEAMLFPEGKYRNFWTQGASVPDITQQETQLWFYYRAVRYIDAGYESIHFGQSDLIGQRDTNRKVWSKILAMVREYGKAHARRHYVLCDAHFYAENAKVGDTYLWDFHGFPLRPVTGSKPFEAYLAEGHADAPYNTMPSGIHPAGWYCDVIPQLYEVDNCFGSINSKTNYLVWGTDEATWFANCTEEYRNSFLKYTADWLKKNVKRGYLEMPGFRPATVPLGSPNPSHVYRFNTKSAACPDGFNQEETIKEIFDRPFEFVPIAPKGQTAKVSVPKGEALGFVKGKASVKESFTKAMASDSSGFNDDILWLYFKAYGAFSPKETAEAAKKQLASYTNINAGAAAAQGIFFDGQEKITIESPMLTASRLSVFMKVKFDNTAFTDSFILMSKAQYLKNGYYIKYFKDDNDLYAEIADGSGKRRLVHFNYPLDEKSHTIGFVADGKTLTAWLDGEKCDSVPSGSVQPNKLILTMGENLSGCLIEDIKFFNYPLQDSEAKWMCR